MSAPRLSDEALARLKEYVECMSARDYEDEDEDGTEEYDTIVASLELLIQWYEESRDL